MAELDGALHLRASGGEALTTAEMVAIFAAEVDRQFHDDVAERTRQHGLVPFPDDLADVDASKRRCETDTGIDLLPDDVVRASLQGHLRRVVMNSAGVVIEMGRKQRLFIGAAREAAKLMATSCDHPDTLPPNDDQLIELARQRVRALVG